MSDEALLILKMVQEGKLTPDQGAAFLDALRRDSEPEAGPEPARAPEPGRPPWGSAGQSRSLPHAQRVLAQLQQQLAEMQAKLGAAQASPPPAPSPSSIKLPFGMGEFNVTSILDETMRGVSALRTEAVVGAKRAARQAQKEARRFRLEAERLGKNIHVEVHVRTDDRMRGQAYAETKTHEERTLRFVGEGAVVTVRNPFGDIKIVGSSGDGSAKLSVSKTARAATAGEREQLLASVRIDEALGADGAVRELSVTAPADLAADDLAVELSIQAPATTRFAVASTSGNVHCESLERSVSHVETRSGDIRLLHIHGAATDGSAEEGCTLETTSGAVTISQWRGAPIAIRSDSATVQLDMIECPSVTVQAASGDAVARGLTIAGDLRLETNSGDLSVSESHVGGACSAKTHSGDLAVTDLTAGSLSLETVSGDALAVRADCGAGRATIKAISGDLRADDVSAREIGLGTTSGDVEAVLASAFAGSIAGSTVSGDLSVAVPTGYAARLTMTTHSGALRCDAPLSDRAGDGEHYLTGSLGESADPPTAMLQSVSGDLRMRTRS